LLDSLLQEIEMLGTIRGKIPSSIPRLAPCIIGFNFPHRSVPVHGLIHPVLNHGLMYPRRTLTTSVPILCNKNSDHASESTDKEVVHKLELEGDNFAVRMYKKIFSGVPKAKLRASGFVLLTHCAQNTDIKGFFTTFDMPDTFYSWFLVTELHVFLLGARVMRDGDLGRMVRNSMVEALWQDCDTRAKSVADMASSVRSKNIVAIAEEFQAALFVYDEGLVGNDMQLANALWRRFFMSMKEAEDAELPDPEKLELLVNYVRRVANYLDITESADIIVKNKIVWPSLIE